MKDNFKLVTDYPITSYQCGLQAGDVVHLIKPLEIWQGGQVIRTHAAGEEWTVMRGSAQPPVVVWLRQPDGKSHTWTDGAEIFEYFERVEKRV